MPLYRCDWPNGDVSWVLARNVELAIEELDEVGDAEESFLTKVSSFSIHLELTDDAKDDPVRAHDDDSDLPEDPGAAEARLCTAGWIVQDIGCHTQMPPVAHALARRASIGPAPEEVHGSARPQGVPAKVLPFLPRGEPEPEDDEPE